MRMGSLTIRPLLAHWCARPPMPAFCKLLSPARVKALIALIRVLGSRVK